MLLSNDASSDFQPEKTSILSVAEKTYVVLSLLYFAGGLTPSDLAENQHSHQIDRFNSLLQLVVFPILLSFIVLRRERFMKALYSFRLPLVFSFLTLVSTLWSPCPGFTLRRAVIMCGLMLFSLYLGSSFTLPEQIDIYGWFAVTFVLGSYCLALIKPEYALSSGNHWGSWKGVFGHKNTLGRMALFAATVLWGASPRGVPKILRQVVGAGSIGLIALSGSATSVMAAAALILVWPAIRILKFNRERTLPLGVALLPLVFSLLIGILANFGFILESLGRDPTLTGRTTLWTAILKVGQKNQFFGSGYAAFWHFNGPDRAALFSQVGWTPPHAHNAYLDMWLDLGYVGIGFLIYLIVVSFVNSIKLYGVSRSGSAVYPIMFLCYVLMVNCTESDLFRTHAFLGAPLVSLYVALRLLEERRQPRLKGLRQHDHSFHGSDSQPCVAWGSS